MVGKGIVYDTGGLSIKACMCLGVQLAWQSTIPALLTACGALQGKEAMPGMKKDKGGAAAVLGAFEALVRLQVACMFGDTHVCQCNTLWVP